MNTILVVLGWLLLAASEANAGALENAREALAAAQEPLSAPVGSVLQHRLDGCRTHPESRFIWEERGDQWDARRALERDNPSLAATCTAALVAAGLLYNKTALNKTALDRCLAEGARYFAERDATPERSDKIQRACETGLALARDHIAQVTAWLKGHKRALDREALERGYVLPEPAAEPE